MAALKEGTADLHEAVERRMDVAGMSSSLDRYRRMLRAFHGLYEPIESRLAAAPADGFDFEAEARTPRLSDDLKAVDDVDLRRLPRCSVLPRVDSVPRFVGALYVLEGASLGGQIISRMLRDRLGITPEAGGRFFHGAGERTGPRWRAFGRAADAAVRSDDDVAEAVAAARETFLAFDRWLAVHGSPEGEDAG